MRRGPRVVIAFAATAAVAAAVVAVVVAPATDSPRPSAPVVVTRVAPVAPARTQQQPAPPPPFDVLACATDLDREGRERGAPPTMTRIRLHSRRELDAAARTIAVALPHTWHAHVELDATGMEKSVELHVDGARAPSATATLLLDLVHAHPCLFGVVAPAALTATSDGDIEHQGVTFDGPRAIGNLYAAADSEGHAYHVELASHLWPIPDRAPTIDPARLVARYVGHTYGAQTGWRMMKGSNGRRGACLPIVSDRTAAVSSFRWHAGRSSRVGVATPRSQTARASMSPVR